MIVYLAGPIVGHTHEEAFGWRERMADALQNMNIVAIVPGADCELGEDGVLREAQRKVGLRAASADNAAIKYSDVVLVNLLGAHRVSIGTMVELGWAREMNKPVLTVLEKGGLHDHPFVEWCSTVVVSTLEQALDILLEYAEVAAGHLAVYS